MAQAPSTPRAPRGTAATSPGAALRTPLAGDAEVTALLAELRHGGLYQRMDEVGPPAARRRHRAHDRAARAKHEAPAKSLERVLRSTAPSAGAAPISRC